MTTDRNKPEELGDGRVSRAYREVAQERTPEKLDARILKAARQPTRTAYSRSIAWLRPMAWAATIGLCLAIVIELSVMPQPEEGTIRMPASAPAVTDTPAADRAAAPRRDAFEEEALSDEALGSATRARSVEEAHAEPVQAGEQKQTAGAMAESPPADLSAPKFEAGRLESVPSAASSPAEVAPSRGLADEKRSTDELEAFRVRKAPILDQAAEMARMRDGRATEADAALSSAVAGALATEEACHEEQTNDPESWLSCIEDLEAAGQEQAASKERDRLRQAFPDFELPD